MLIPGPRTALRLFALALTALVGDNQGRRTNVSSFGDLKLQFGRDLLQKYLALLSSHRYENRPPGSFFLKKVAPSRSIREHPYPHLEQALKAETVRLLDPADHPVLTTTRSLTTMMQYLKMTALYPMMRRPMDGVSINYFPGSPEVRVLLALSIIFISY